MTKPSKPRKKTGTPKGVQAKRIDFDEVQIKQCERYSGVGLNLDQIAALMDVSPKTLDNIIARQPEVAYALKKGKARAIAQVATSLFSVAVDSKHPKQLSAIFFFLKCQARWVEARDEGENLKEDPYEPPDSLVDDEDDN
jgi:hypothetical protein